MKINYLYPFWGSEHLSPAEFISFVTSKGFDGIEMNIPAEDNFEAAFELALNKARRVNAQFTCVLQQVFGVEKESPQAYLEKVINRLESFVRYQPNFINSHTGKDHYSFDDNCRIIEAIESFAVRHRIPVYHEIHRGRFTFHSQTTLAYLKEFPHLKLVGDLSHWCVVSESMLEDQEVIIQQVIPHIQHIHARIGFTQAPQVNHPFASEWSTQLHTFTRWWQAIVDYHRSRKYLTITPEFGPYPYMPEEPFTRNPLANQESINIKMKNYLELHLK